MVRLPLKLASIELIVIVSLPPPALIVSELAGVANVTLSAAVDAMVIPAPDASVKVMVSLEAPNVNTRSETTVLSKIGSSPV